VDVTSIELSDGWVLAAWCFAIPLLGWVAWRAPWQRLGEKSVTGVWHGGILTVVVLWSIQATVSDQFTFHLLGLAGLMLALGARLALASAAVVVAVHCGIHGGTWANTAAVWLTLCVPAIAITALALHLSQRFLPPNFFIYIFVVAFLGTALSLAVAGSAALLLLSAGTALPVARAFSEYAPYLLQLGFGEATLTGMIMTIGVVYRPQWVTTFDDSRYLKSR
jgi:uncharacterized membrane protein